MQLFGHLPQVSLPYPDSYLLSLHFHKDWSHGWKKPQTSGSSGLTVELCLLITGTQAGGVKCPDGSPHSLAMSLCRPLPLVTGGQAGACCSKGTVGSGQRCSLG